MRSVLTLNRGPNIDGDTKSLELRVSKDLDDD